jgi:hypothetical protein
MNENIYDNRNEAEIFVAFGSQRARKKVIQHFSTSRNSGNISLALVLARAA